MSITSSKEPHVSEAQIKGQIDTPFDHKKGNPPERCVVCNKQVLASGSQGEDCKRRLRKIRSDHEQLSDFLKCAFSYFADDAGLVSEINPDCLPISECVEWLQTWIQNHHESGEIRITDRATVRELLEEVGKVEAERSKLYRKLAALGLESVSETDLTSLSIGFGWASSEFIECLLHHISGLALYYLENSLEQAKAQAFVCSLLEDLPFGGATNGDSEDKGA